MFKKNDTSGDGLKIIIVGGGKVGATLIEQLSGEGHDITLIDKNAKKLQAITEMYDVMGIVGNGASYNIQMEAGIEDADLFVSVTDSDELNLLCCTVAKRVGQCAAIARVRTPDYSDEISYLRDKLGLAMIINPEYESASEVARLLYLPKALEINTFSHGLAEMIKIKIPKDNIIIGKSVADLGKHMQVRFQICAVERDGEVYIPSGAFIFEEGDLVSFIASRQNAREFLRQIGFATNQVKDAMIIGGGKSAYYLAKQLINVGIGVKIIESDLKRCEELSDMLPEAIIINGDGTDESVLREEGIEYVESFIPLTGIDEENIMLTLHAKNVSNAKVITKINRINYKDVISSLDLGSVIYPRYITSEAIIAYVRARKASIDSNIETLYHLFGQRVEAIEFFVDKKSELTGIPLKDLELKDNLVVAIIHRNGRIFIPRGNDCMEQGDSVVVVTKHTGFNDIKDILK